MTEPEKKEDDKKHSKTLSEFIFKFLEDRVGDPLWRSFAFFFILYNWKAFVALILGKFDNPEDRIKLVAKYFTESDFVSTKLELIRSNFIFISITYGSILFISLVIMYFFIKRHSSVENVRKCFAEFINIFALNVFIFGMFIIVHDFNRLRFITVPFFEAFIFIFVYMRYIKPLVVKIYNINNNLSLESAQSQLNEKENEINNLKKEKQDEINKLNKDIDRLAVDNEEKEKKWESSANLLDIFIIKHLKFDYLNLVRKADSTYNGKKKGEIYTNYEGRERLVLDENKDMILDVDKEMYDELIIKLKGSLK